MLDSITLERILVAFFQTVGVEIVIFIIAKWLGKIGEIADVIIVGSLFGIIPSVILGAIYGFKTIIITMIVCIVIMGIIASDDNPKKSSCSNDNTFLEELGVILGLHMIEKSYRENKRKNDKNEKK